MTLIARITVGQHELCNLYYVFVVLEVTRLRTHPIVQVLWKIIFCTWMMLKSNILLPYYSLDTVLLVECCHLVFTHQMGLMFWRNLCVHFCSVVYAKTKQFSSHFHMLLRVRIYTSYYCTSILIVHLCVSSSPILTWPYVFLDWLVLYYCFVLWMVDRQRLFLFSESVDTAWLFMSVVYVEVLKCGTFEDLYHTVMEYIGFNLK